MQHDSVNVNGFTTRCRTSRASATHSHHRAAFSVLTPSAILTPPPPPLASPLSHCPSIISSYSDILPGVLRQEESHASSVLCLNIHTCKFAHRFACTSRLLVPPFRYPCRGRSLLQGLLGKEEKGTTGTAHTGASGSLHSHREREVQPASSIKWGRPHNHHFLTPQFAQFASRKFALAAQRNDGWARLALPLLKPQRKMGKTAEHNRRQVNNNNNDNSCSLGNRGTYAECAPPPPPPPPPTYPSNY